MQSLPSIIHNDWLPYACPVDQMFHVVRRALLIAPAVKLSSYVGCGSEKGGGDGRRDGEDGGDGEQRQDRFLTLGALPGTTKTIGSRIKTRKGGWGAMLEGSRGGSLKKGQRDPTGNNSPVMVVQAQAQAQAPRRKH